MGKIKTEGRVTLEFDAELYEISVTVRTEGETSGAAVTAGRQQTEALLAAFRDYGVSRRGSFLIGDRMSDVDAALNAGIPGYLFTGSNLLDFVRQILARQARGCGI